MASPSSPQHEPTMEEILASIRKIISEDSSEPAPQAAPAPAAKAPVEADVLELTQEIHEVAAPEPEPVIAAAPPPPPAPEPEPVKPADEVVFQTIEEPPPAKPEPALQAHASDELVSDKARGAIDEALAGLDFGAEEHAAPLPVAPIDGRSVEAVFDRAVRETFDPVLRTWLQEQAEVIVDRMKPAIREWLDDNLPGMLKSAVEAEVARVVRNRGRR